ASIRELDKAERLFAEAQTILEQNGSPARDLAWVHNNHGLVQLENGQYAAGLRSFRAANAALAPRREEYPEARVPVLENLASAYCLLGDAEHSESAYLDALELLRRTGKEGSRPYQTTRANLAILYGTINNFEDARRILE